MAETRPSHQDEKRGWITRALAGGALGAVAKHVTVTWGIPIGSALVTGLAGVAEGLPWMYVLAGTGVMFASATTGLVKFDDWRERRRVKGKLHLAQIRIAQDIGGTPGLMFGATLHNNASVAIEFEVVELRTKINNRVPAKAYPRVVATIAPIQEAWFNDHIIDVGPFPKLSTLEGSIEAVVKYGRPGHRKHTFFIRQNVVIAFNAQGLPENVSCFEALSA